MPRPPAPAGIRRGATLQIAGAGPGPSPPAVTTVPGYFAGSWGDRIDSQGRSVVAPMPSIVARRAGLLLADRRPDDAKRPGVRAGPGSAARREALAEEQPRQGRRR